MYESLYNNGINYQPELVQDFSHQQYHMPGISALRLGKGVRVLRVFRLIRVLKGGGILQDESDSLVVDVGVAFGGGKAHFLRSHGIHGTGIRLPTFMSWKIK